MILNLIFYIGIIFIALYVKLKLFKSRVEKLLLKVPGPDYNVFIGNIRRFAVKREELFGTILNLCREYDHSPIVRVWIGNRPRIFITKAEAAEGIMGNPNQSVKGDTYNLAKVWLHEGLLLSSGAKWFHRRRMITPTFHFRILEQFREIMDEQGDILATVLGENKENWFNVYPYLTRCTLDVLCESAMGVKLHCQKGGAQDYLQSIIGIAECFMQRVFNFWLRSNLIFKYSEAGKLQQKYLEYLHGFTRKVIRERKAEFKRLKALRKDDDNEESVFGQKRRLAFLDMLLEAQDSDNSIDDDGIQEEVDMFLFAGHDTTASATNWIFYNLARFPEIQEKVREELNSIVGEERLQSISTEDLRQLKYMECVIKESMRLFTPVPLYSRNLSQDINLCGYHLPAGIDVGFVSHLIHTDPAHWPNPLKFDPDRFLPENAANRHPYAYIPFSAGQRNCLGQKFAMMELKTLVSHVVHRYHIRTKTKIEDVKLLAEFILRPADGNWLKLEKVRSDD